MRAQPSRLRTNVRPTTDRFVGRSAELAQLDALFAEGSRLITLFGSAGTGKTRLAESYGLRVLGEYGAAGSGGVWICDLAEERTLEGVCAAIGHVLEVPPSPASSDDDLVRRLGDAIAARGPVLLILDNFEHLVPFSAATVGVWLTAAPEVRFLLTSREQLRLRGEIRFELPPLALPAGPDDVDGADAVQLFVDRVRWFDPSFALHERNRSSAAALVRKLEGIPLAIELAASRVELFGIEGLLDNLDKRLDVLIDSHGSAHSRHATLRVALGWSWDLLDDCERLVLSRCSVFRGGFDADAAREVLGPTPDNRPVLAVVQSLRDKSLLRRYELEDAPGRPRFSLFEIVREFAEEHLSSEERAATAARHSQYYLTTADRWISDVGSSQSATALRNLSREHDNLLAIAEQQPTDGAGTIEALRGALALDTVVSIRGPLASHLDLLERTIKATEQHQVEPELLIRGLCARAKARLLHGHPGSALRDLERALTLAEQAGDPPQHAQALSDLGVHRHQQREMTAAQELYEEALRKARQAADRHTEGRVLGNLGALHHDQRRFDQALPSYHQALEVLREVGDERLEAIHVSNLGTLELERSQFDRAHAHFDAAIELLQHLGDRRLQGIVMGNLGNLEHQQGRPREARQYHEEALGILRAVGDRRSESLCLGRLGRANASLGWLDDARGCLAAADRLHSRHPDPFVAATVAVDRAFLDLALARKSGRGSEADGHIASARARMEAAKAPGPDGRPWTEVNDDIRIALRILERELESVAQPPAVAETRIGKAFVAGPECRWIQPPGGDPQDLSRRKALRLILVRLIEHQRQSPGAGVALEQLLATGWPGERVVPSAGANRVYVALTTLRKLGLRGYLLSQDDGYLLDPALSIERVDTAWSDVKRQPSR